ncbi:MAG: UDP-2,3-diacylglucosamine diphosphatase [Patescibacteria group bacterium]
MKNIIFISDLHLGAGAANDFHESYHLHRLLDYAAENASELVILGDLLELLQSEFLEIYAEHHSIFEHFFALAEKIPVKYILGNHDAAAAIDVNPRGKSAFLGSKIQVLPEYENLPLKIFAAHGHQFSLANRHDNILDFAEVSVGDRVTKFVGWMERNIHPKIDNWMESLYFKYRKLMHRFSRNAKNFAYLVTPANPLYRALGGDFAEYETAARNVLASERYSVCVFGHTHIPQIKALEDKIYANSGSWVGENQITEPPIFLDIDANFVRMIDARTFEVIGSVSREQPKITKPHKASIFKNKVIV